MMMRHRGSRAPCVVALLACCALTGCGSKEPEQIQQSFERFMAAGASNDGPATVSMLSQNTIEYYERIRQHALESGPEQITALSFMDMLQIGTVRMNLTPDYLRQLTGAQLIMVGMRDGWMNSAKTAPGSLTLGEITIDGDRASAEVVFGGEKAPFAFGFTKDAGAWKCDLMPMVEWSTGLTEGILRSGAKSAGQSTEQLVRITLGMRIKQTIGPEIWEKPKLK